MFCWWRSASIAQDVGIFWTSSFLKTDFFLTPYDLNLHLPLFFFPLSSSFFLSFYSSFALFLFFISSSSHHFNFRLKFYELLEFYTRISIFSFVPSFNSCFSRVHYCQSFFHKVLHHHPLQITTFHTFFDWWRHPKFHLFLIE